MPTKNALSEAGILRAEEITASTQFLGVNPAHEALARLANV